MAHEPNRSGDAPPPHEAATYRPYLTRTRADWAALAATQTVTLDEETLDRLRGLDDPTDAAEVREVYLPLAQLIGLYIERTADLFETTHEFLGINQRRTPFVIGVAGSVAVGKSTTSRLLRELLSRGPGRPRVDLVTTDGFLYPNARLEAMGLMKRKGFPESYDRAALLRFVMDVKAGEREVRAPVYSHLVYDIVPDEQIVVRSPDVLIVEGLNVLQPARQRAQGLASLAVSDFFDFSVYVDASNANVREWYLSRFLQLRETAFRNPQSYFTRYAAMSDDEALATAAGIWDSINGPNLTLNIKPTRGRATAILRKGDDHRVDWVRIRKV